MYLIIRIIYLFGIIRGLQNERWNYYKFKIVRAQATLSLSNFTQEKTFHITVIKNRGL